MSSRPDIQAIADALYATAIRQLDTTDAGKQMLATFSREFLEAWLRNVAGNMAYHVDSMMEDLEDAQPVIIG